MSTMIASSKYPRMPMMPETKNTNYTFSCLNTSYDHETIKEIGRRRKCTFRDEINRTYNVDNTHKHLKSKFEKRITKKKPLRMDSPYYYVQKNIQTKQKKLDQLK